jgi:glutamate formiminotransferase
LAQRIPGCADLHSDPDHHRSVLTLLGHAEALVDAVLELAHQVVGEFDLADHLGVHPRIGTLDVVPFVPLGHATLSQAVVLRDEAARRLSEELDLPCFLYGPLDGGSRSLPELRRCAFKSLEPDRGPLRPHPKAGSVAVGARLPLLAWNVWLRGIALAEAKALAAALRSSDVRALGLSVGSSVQVSCNLLEPSVTTPAHVFDALADRLGPGELERCELVGLAPRSVLDAIEPTRWASLDLSEAKTIEQAARSLGLELV